MKRSIIKFTLLLSLLVFLGILVLFGHETDYTTKYFETFRYVNNGNDKSQIEFINELTQKQISNKWYIQVYWDSDNKDNKWVKFEKYKASNDKETPDGSYVQTIENTLSIKSIIKNTNPLNISSTDDKSKS